MYMNQLLDTEPHRRLDEELWDDYVPSIDLLESCFFSSKSKK